MTKTTSADLELKKVQAKFTRLKAAVDGTPEAEEKYQKAKKGLAMARQAYTDQRHAPGRPGDANAQVTAVAAKAKANKKG